MPLGNLMYYLDNDLHCHCIVVSVLALWAVSVCSDCSSYFTISFDLVNNFPFLSQSHFPMQCNACDAVRNCYASSAVTLRDLSVILR